VVADAAEAPAAAAALEVLVPAFAHPINPAAASAKAVPDKVELNLRSMMHSFIKVKNK